MPWTAKDAKAHTSKADTPEKQARWAAVANDALERCLDEGGEQNECEASAIRQANAIVAGIGEGTKAQVTKKEADGEHPASHYLVVEDPDSPSTWHLRVRDADGNLDHRLMGAAWAALHGGYRGNVYQGPDKERAIARLVQLYKGEKMDVPGAKARVAGTVVKAVETEGEDWLLDVLAVPYGRDSDGDYFDEQSDLHPDKWPQPPAVYYHGFTDRIAAGHEQPRVEYIGKALRRWRDEAGEWIRYALDRGSETARRVWEAAQKGLARASSGSAAHLVRKDADGHIREWPLIEVSIFDAVDGRQPVHPHAVAIPALRAVYERAGLALPEDIEPVPGAEPEAGRVPAATAGRAGENGNTHDGDTEMSDELESKIDGAVTKALEAYEKRKAEQAEREAALKAEREAEVQSAVEAALKAEREEWAKKFRLPDGSGQAPYFNRINDRKYDNLAPADMAFMIGTLKAASERGHGAAPRPEAYTSLALKAASQREAELKAGPREDDMDLGRPALKAMAALESAAGHAIKSNEIMQQDLSNYGDDWVGVFYSNQLWEAVRAGTFVVERMPKAEVPAGHESMVIPLESTDPTWYKVAEAATITDTTTGIPDVTVTASKMGTGKQTLSLAKMGARVLWSGELNEDSLIPFVPQLRRQMERSGAEQLEHVVIDGDTTTTASTNINDIAGTPASTDAFLLVDGLRKLPLVTNTANKRDAGALTDGDFLETVKLMGAAGKNADVARVTLIPDPNTYWKALELASVKTQDVFRNATLENGRLARIWGYEVQPSWMMHYKSADRKANSAGKIDQDTTANNAYGAILAVRWDQWLFGWRRRMTMETTRYARADATELVALMRFGLIYRDAEAAAISYNVTI